MIVSILQRLGLRAARHPGEPLQSRADSSTRTSPSKRQGEKVRVSTGLKTAGAAADKPDNQVKDRVGTAKAGLARSQHGDHPEAASPRRPSVKAQAKKTKVAVKPAGKAASAGKAKTTPKAMTKTAKPAKPAVSKTAAKKPAPSAKVSAKVKPKTAARPVAKPKAKVIAKAKPVPTKKTPAAAKKPAPAAKPRTVAKPVKSAKPAVVKAAVKKSPVVKPAVKAAKPSVKPAQPLVKGKASAKPEEKVIKTIAKTAASPAVKTPPAPASIAAAPSPLPTPAPLKPGRRASLRSSSFAPPPAPMIPTHSPDAAKASYSTIAEKVIAPPPHVAAKKDPKLANNWKTKPGHELTDEEVKAMPDAEYMNEKQLAFFRHKLSVLKQDIHNSAGETTEHLREDTVVVPDPADRATIEEEHALELRTRDRERKLLKKIEQSIARIDSGDYGYCDETGEAIGVGRLIARPTANLSLEAQQRRELKQKMFGD
jgi:DnaK suppressor protein